MPGSFPHKPILLSLAILLVCIFGSCRERYELPLEKSLSNSLVVEGNIMKGDTTTIKLSRVSAVSERNLVPETGAAIQVEGDDNSIYSLSEQEPGVYKVSPINLNATTQYRAKLSAAGKEYESAWLRLINTPQIDSVSW